MFARILLRKSLIFAFILALPLVTALPGLGAAESISEADAVSLIRSAQIVKQDFPLRAVISGKEIVVQTRRGAKASDKDCKIDAVFIAKTLLDSYPKSVNVVKVLFAHDADDKYSEVAVTASQIADFAEKRITQQKLLDSVLLSSVDPLSAAKPNTDQDAVLEPGPYRERRLMLLDRIQSLKSKGTGTKPFEQLFKESEAQIKAGKTAEADATLTTLADTLKLQELQREHLRNFHPVALSSPSHSGNGKTADDLKRELTKNGTVAGRPPLAENQPPNANSGSAGGNNVPPPGGGPPGELSGPHGLNGGPHWGPPGGVEVRPIHSPQDFEQRMRQIEEHKRSQSESLQPALQSAMERVKRMLDESRIKDAEVELRRLERDLGCSSQFWNKVP